MSNNRSLKAFTKNPVLNNVSCWNINLMLNIIEDSLALFRTCSTSWLRGITCILYSKKQCWLNCLLLSSCKFKDKETKALWYITLQNVSVNVSSFVVLSFASVTRIFQSSFATKEVSSPILVGTEDLSIQITPPMSMQPYLAIDNPDWTDVDSFLLFWPQPLFALKRKYWGAVFFQIISLPQSLASCIARKHWSPGPYKVTKHYWLLRGR